MDKKKAHTKAGSKDKINFKNNSASNQRKKLLAHLFQHGNITSIEAKEKLDIYSPAARIKSLRDAGYLIDLVWVVWESEHGIKHRIGKYVLVQKEPVETDKDSEVA